MRLKPSEVGMVPWILFLTAFIGSIGVVLYSVKWDGGSPCDEVCRGSDVLWCKTSPEGKQAACQVDDNTVCMRMTFGSMREVCAPRKRGAPVK